MPIKIAKVFGFVFNNNIKCLQEHNKTCTFFISDKSVNKQFSCLYKEP